MKRARSGCQKQSVARWKARGLIESKAKVKRPLGSWSGKKHCFLGPWISGICYLQGAGSAFSRLAAAAFSMSPYGGGPDRSIQATA